MRGSREISLVPSLHRASTDALIIIAIYFACYKHALNNSHIKKELEIGGELLRASQHIRSRYGSHAPQCFISLTLGMHAQRGLLYLVCIYMVSRCAG